MQTKRNSRSLRFGGATAFLSLTSSILAQGPQKIPSTLAPASTPAHQIFDLSIFVVYITGGIFLVVGGLLAVALFRFRGRKSDSLAEPPQIYGSTQIELPDPAALRKHGRDCGISRYPRIALESQPVSPGRDTRGVYAAKSITKRINTGHLKVYGPRWRPLLQILSNYLGSRGDFPACRPRRKYAWIE